MLLQNFEGKHLDTTFDDGAALKSLHIGVAANRSRSNASHDARFLKGLPGCGLLWGKVGYRPALGNDPSLGVPACDQKDKEGALYMTIW